MLKMKQKMEKMQVLNDGADEEDFKELLQILRSFRELVQLIRQLKITCEVSLVEKGEIDSTPTMQNALKPKKQKTVTEIIHDQLGPGLDPDILLDVIKDDSKNDEDSNRAK